MAKKSLKNKTPSWFNDPSLKLKQAGFKKEYVAKGLDRWVKETKNHKLLMLHYINLNRLIIGASVNGTTTYTDDKFVSVSRALKAFPNFVKSLKPEKVRSKVRLTEKDTDIIIDMMIDLWSRELDCMLTREISDKYGLSMKKTLEVMHELEANGFEAFEGGKLVHNSEDGGWSTDTYIKKHTYWFIS